MINEHFYRHHYWYAATTGEYIRIQDMTNQHIKNVIFYFLKNEHLPERPVDLELKNKQLVYDYDYEKAFANVVREAYCRELFLDENNEKR